MRIVRIDIRMYLFKILALFYIFKKREPISVDYILGYRAWYKGSKHTFMPIILTKDYVLIYGARRLAQDIKFNHSYSYCIIMGFKYS